MIVACGDVVLESLKQIEECDFTASPDKSITHIEKDVSDIMLTLPMSTKGIGSS